MTVPQSVPQLTDRCQRCSGTEFLGGSVDLCAVLCDRCADAFNRWADRFPDRPYVEWWATA